MYKTIRVEEAVGQVLAHDVTEIRKGEFKGPAFRKGHIIRPADVCHLQRLGKRHVYVLEPEPGHLHEDDAVMALAAAFCGDGVYGSGEPREGKLHLRAQRDGLFTVDVDALYRVNLLGEVMCASRHTHSLVKKEAVVAATRAIPLLVPASTVEAAVAIARAAGGLFRVNPLRKANVGLVITGSEVFSRLIEDQFEPVVRQKIDAIGSEIIGVALAPDDAAAIRSEILKLLAAGADLLLTTGGLSVDPDDVTRLGIQQAGGEIRFYGAPVLPGAMFLLAYIGKVPVLGLPACGIYHEATIFDLILPRVLAGENLTRRDLARMGHGGLCLHCSACRYPVCPFGR